jgi:lipopolysaccharide/colanic/teichoic acid biosynthesis glycosyltransferase
VPDARRILDVALAGAASFVTAPLIALLAAAVKLDSPGPALFVQTRVGRGGKPIRITKLRTMTADAERTGPPVTTASDRRITRVGAVLRRTKLDELPQLWSVVRGDMSLVGPRPEVPRYVARYRPEWQPLLAVRPGITDLASLAFHNEEGLLAGARDREQAYTDVVMPLKLELALTGVARASVLTDVSVLVRTALTLLRLSGTHEHPSVRETRRRIAELDPS